MRRPASALVVFLLLVAPGCKKKKPADPDETPKVQGSGVGSFESRTLPPFTRINIGGALDVTINVGKNAPLELRGEDNLIKLVPSTVVNGELELKPEVNLKTTQPLKVTLGTESLERVIVAVAAKVVVHGAKATAFEVATGGAARLVVDGSASKLTVSARSVSQVDLTAFSAAEATVTASDMSNVRVGYLEKLDATQKGHALVVYRGKPDLTLHAEKASRVGPIDQ
jgi:hypothetical protein